MRMLPEKKTLLLLIAAFHWKVSLAAIGIYKTVTADCLNWSLSVWQKPRPSDSLLDCFMSSRSQSLGSVGIVQRNKRDASCTLFRFSQVCRLLNLSHIASPSTGIDKMDCEIVVDSEYDAVTANKHFDAVWVGDRGPQLENVVCGSDGPKNPMRSSNVMWTSEGARMDGVSSRLWVDDPSGLDFTGSFTFAIHLKRAPKWNSLIELAKCSALSQFVDHFWEFSYTAGVDKSLYLNPGQPAWFQTGSELPDNARAFFIASVAYNRPLSEIKFMFGSQVLLPQYQSPRMENYNRSGVCIKIGWRDLSSGVVDGVIRAAAVSRQVLPAEVIRQLFT